MTVMYNDCSCQDSSTGIGKVAVPSSAAAQLQKPIAKWLSAGDLRAWCPGF
jgi:hypothetical protein